MNDTPWWKGARGEWYVVIQFVLLALVLLGPKVWPGLPRWDAPWSTVSLIAGVLLVAAGGLLGLSGLASLGRNLTAVPHPKDDAVLVEHGAYRIVRHPIYSGIIFGCFAWALVWSSPATLLYAAILLVFFDVKARREERALTAKFPQYADYQRRVRKLIPFVY